MIYEIIKTNRSLACIQHVVNSLRLMDTGSRSGQVGQFYVPNR